MNKYLSITFLFLFLGCNEDLKKSAVDKQIFRKDLITVNQGKLIFDKIKLL